MYSELETKTVPSRNVITFPRPIAFGEHLGIAVPTRYDESTHEVVNGVMFMDSLVTPMLLGMSERTVWTCRFLAALLFLTRRSSTSLKLRQVLQIEAAAGLMIILAAWKGAITRRFWENCYLTIGGVMMIANALMTELND